VANQVGQVSHSEAKAMLKLASSNGLDTLDTAIAYGDSEACLGKVGAKNFKLITKLPVAPHGCHDIGVWVLEQVKASFLRLGVTKVYGLLLHRSDQLLGSNSALLYKALLDLKDNGLVQKVGVSIYSPTELDALSSTYHFDLVQAPFNLVDQRLYRSGWLQRLKEDDIEIHTRSVFLQGLLLMKRAEIPQKFSPWICLWKKWHEWLEGNSVSALEASLAFPLAFSEVDRVIVGADSVSQLSQIISAANLLANIALPDLRCDDSNLINPACWNQL
jgi:aryl-alcohol dehydrogenase-like predicted oxidoreductase